MYLEKKSEAAVTFAGLVASRRASAQATCARGARTNPSTASPTAKLTSAPTEDSTPELQKITSLHERGGALELCNTGDGRGNFYKAVTRIEPGTPLFVYGGELRAKADRLRKAS